MAKSRSRRFSFLQLVEKDKENAVMASADNNEREFKAIIIDLIPYR